MLGHVSRSTEISGPLRKKGYELPAGAIRGAVISAQYHLSFMDSSCVQVALSSDRLEIISPGMLYSRLTLREAVSGRSKMRNKAIAEILNRMELIKEWDTGIRRIIKRVKEYQLHIPGFVEIGDTFRVNLFRKEGKKPIEASRKPLSEERQQLIREYIRKHGCISNQEARELLSLAKSTTKGLLKQMVLGGYLIEQRERKSRIYRLRA